MKKRILEDIKNIMSGLRLSNAQWALLASSAKTFGDGILLGASAAFFLPETLQLKEPISIDRFATLIFSGLLIISAGVILISRGTNDRPKR